MITFAIETSCDETSSAVLSGRSVVSNIISTQLSHSKFGGVVPEVASREHLKKVTHVSNEALNIAGKTFNDVDLICATTSPGLIGALLVGSNFAKGIAVSLNKPFLAVNHIQAHLYSPFIGIESIEFPFLGLIVSGGHTLLILANSDYRHMIIGRTIDDAAGEAFDKGAKLLGLGYPGGKLIDIESSNGDPAYHRFPKSILKNSEFNFSFSGIKTSLLYFLRDNFKETKPEGDDLSNICASYQSVIIDMLFEKTLAAARKFDVKTIAISGGVSSNSEIRRRFTALKEKGFQTFFPANEYSTDNAAMIGFAGYLKYLHEPSTAEQLSVHAKPRLDYENF